MGLCRFRHVFGREREGVHRPRFLGMAAVDLALTLAAAVALGLWRGLSWRGVALAFLALLAASVLVHRLFCVNTALTVAVFGSRA